MSAAPDRSRLVDLLARLVAINTENPPGNESEAAGLLAGELKAAGLNVETRDYAPGRTNVIATLDNGPGPVFAFNTHTDVVLAGEGWESPPFELTERDGRLYGRGACDAKGQVAAMTEAARLLAAGRDGWQGRLIVTFVADEETASRGAKAYAAEKPKIDYAIVGEPTSNRVVTAHKGSVRPLIRVHGAAAHSGTPDRGVNAILKAAALMPRLAAYHQRLKASSHPLCGQPSAAVTRIHGGFADNIVPDSCAFQLDRRMIPGETDADVLAEIAALLDAARTEDGVEAEIAELLPVTGPAAETPADAALVEAALAVVRAHGVEAGGPEGFQGGCDMTHFVGLGAETVVIGPGDLALAHTPHENVAPDELAVASLIYRDIVQRLLSPAGG